MPEIINCPQCQRQLRVPDNLFGQSVRCPSCAITFLATPAETTAPPPRVEELPPSERVSGWSRQAEPPPQPEPHDAPEPHYPGPAWRRGPYDYWPVRRDLKPHNGAAILTLGILSLVICGILGPIAWIMGSNDLAQMRAGQMDPSGEGLTQGGKICGMISSILLMIACAFYGAMLMIAGIGSL
jgi:hypothetical protein